MFLPDKLFPAYSYEHSSLVRKFVNYGQKSFIILGPERLFQGAAEELAPAPADPNPLRRSRRQRRQGSVGLKKRGLLRHRRVKNKLECLPLKLFARAFPV